MAQQFDLLLTSCQISQQWTACLWDYTSGNSIQTYKNGGVATPKTLKIIGNDYFLSGESTKPLLHIWPVNSQEQLKNQKCVLPEPTNVVSVCPFNTYLAAGIGSKLYIWQIASGKLLCVQQKHLQPITCIEFADNDFLITAAHDGMLVVYNLGSLVSLQGNILPQSEVGQTEPLYSKLDHSLPITDLYVGKFGAKSRIVTISIDQTCKIYSLIDGNLLLTVIFSQPLTAVVVDAVFWNLYIGDNSGEIIHFNLKNPPRAMEHHISNDKNILNYVGHTKKVNCLSLNLSGEILASGSEDGQVLIWEIKSRQIIRKLEHKGPVTNIIFVLKHENIFSQNFKPNYIVKTLERSLDFEADKFIVPIIQNEKIVFSDDGEDESGANSCLNQHVNELETELSKVNVINKQLYDGMIKLIKKYNNVE